MGETKFFRVTFNIGRKKVTGVLATKTKNPKQVFKGLLTKAAKRKKLVKKPELTRFKRVSQEEAINQAIKSRKKIVTIKDVERIFSKLKRKSIGFAVTRRKIKTKR